MKQVIIIRGESDCYACGNWIMQSISNWDEVTDDEFAALRKYLPKSGTYLIERLNTQEHLETVKDAVKWCALERKKAEARKEAEEKMKAERTAKRAALQEEKDKKKLEELRKKLGL